MKKKYAIVIVCGTLILLGGILLFRQHPLKVVNLYKASATIANAQFPYVAANNTVDFFTGSSFASFNATTGNTTTLSPQFVLPTVSAVHWSKNGVLLKVTDYSQLDDLYPALVNDSQSTTSGKAYWWLYDFNSQRMSLLTPSNPAERIVDASWDANGSDYAYITNDGAVYASYSPSQKVYQARNGTTIEQFVGTMLYLDENNQLKQINTSNHHVTTLVKTAFNTVYVSSDGKTVAYVVGGDESAGTLYQLDPLTNKTHKVTGDFIGVISGMAGNIYTAYEDSKHVVHINYYPVKGRPVTYSLSGILNQDSGLAQVLPQDGSHVYLQAANNDLALGSTSATFRGTPINNNYKIETDLYLSGFEIHYNPDKNTYEIDIDQNPFSQYQDAALAYIKAQGIDPNQIVINWRVGSDGVTQSNSHVDTALPSGSAN